MASETRVEIPSKFEILREVVKDYPGILSASETLFRELNTHPPDWGFIVRELRTHALKNFYLHDNHEKGIEAIRITSISLGVNSNDMSAQQAAVESLVFYLEKILVDGSKDLQRYGAILQDCFVRLNQLPDKQFSLLVTNPHQLKKLGQIVLGKMPQGFDTRYSTIFFRYFSDIQVLA
jgi:hypothetical protein